MDDLEKVNGLTLTCQWLIISLAKNTSLRLNLICLHNHYIYLKIAHTISPFLHVVAHLGICYLSPSALGHLSLTN